jgi:hypothetical protein
MIEGGTSTDQRLDQAAATTKAKGAAVISHQPEARLCR